MRPTKQNSSVTINGRRINLPIGFRFRPTDELLIEKYLKSKVLNLPIPVSAVTDFNVFLANPSDLPGELNEKRYFFTKQSSFLRKSVGSGSWNSTGEETSIVNKEGDEVIGFKKTLVFSDITSTAATPEWIMHEYRLPAQVESKDWAVYCLFQNKEIPENQRMEENEIIVDPTAEEESSSSSCSSEVTEMSSTVDHNCTDQEQTSTTKDLDSSS